MSFRQIVSPGALFLQQSERAAQFHGIRFKELTTISDWIYVRSRRQLVNQSLHDERVVRVAYRAPPQHRYIDSWVVHGNVKVRNVVAAIRRAFDCCCIDAILYEQTGKHSASD